jgi:hypothetical protein
MSYHGLDRAGAAEETRTVAWRLIAVLAVALSVALLARIALGPALS